MESRPDFKGRNDVLVGDRKIYGSAQFSWYHSFVQSGTFLVNIDFEVMERALTPPALKFAGKPARSIRERVTSLSREVGRALETREVMGRFANHVAEVLDIRLVPGELTTAELDLASELLAVKYSTDKWNLGSQVEFQITVADRMDEGVICLSADIEGKIIQKAHVTGDILLSHRQELDDLEASMAGCSLQEAQVTVQAAPLSASIRETLLHLLEKLGKEVLDISSIRLKEKET